MPRTSLNFLANTFFLQDVLPVSKALMYCLKVLPKSVLDNSQFVIQDDCRSRAKKHFGRTVGKGTSQSLGQSLVSGFHLPLDTSFTREGGARDAQRFCSRSPRWLKTSSPPPSSLNLASAISFPETSFHANPPLPLLIPGEFTSIRASAWRPQPSHTKAFYSSSSSSSSGRRGRGAGTRQGCSHCPAQHWLINLSSLHRSRRFQRPSPPSPDATGPGRLCSGQAQQGELHQAVPRSRCGRGLAAPNDRLCLLPAPLPSRRDTDLLPAITGGLQLLGCHKHRHNCSLFSPRPGGTGLPSAAFPQPFANPRGRDGEHQLSNCQNFFSPPIYANVSTRRNIDPAEDFLSPPKTYCSFHANLSCPISPRR